MHQCNVCSKWFPRPSGLATHMNTHTGNKRTSLIVGLICLLTPCLQSQHLNAQCQTVTSFSLSVRMPDVT
jgi:hypothetical protein